MFCDCILRDAPRSSLTGCPREENAVTVDHAAGGETMVMMARDSTRQRDLQRKRPLFLFPNLSVLCLGLRPTAMLSIDRLSPRVQR